MTDQFTPIPNWEMYSINADGDVKRYNRILKTHLWHGRPRVKLSKEGKRKTFSIEQLKQLKTK